MATDKKQTHPFLSYVGPFAIFMLLLALPDVLKIFSIDIPPQIWPYTLQTLVCGSVLWMWRRHYEFRPASGLLLGAIMGVIGILLWIAPGWLFQTLKMPAGWWGHLGFTDRSEGFDPTGLKSNGNAAYIAFLLMRFARLVVIVPLIEEIFWRGFLMRFLADPEGDYWQVPFGSYHHQSLIGVTAMFVLAHASVDYFGATIYGLLTYWVAVRTKSLAACVVMHAVANLLLGIYILNSQQWGYW